MSDNKSTLASSVIIRIETEDALITLGDRDTLFVRPSDPTADATLSLELLALIRGVQNVEAAWENDPLGFKE